MAAQRLFLRFAFFALFFLICVNVLLSLRTYQLYEDHVRIVNAYVSANGARGGTKVGAKGAAKGGARSGVGGWLPAGWGVATAAPNRRRQDAGAPAAKNDTKLATTPPPEPLNLCPPTPPNLRGRLTGNLKVHSLSETASVHPELRAGGRWRPNGCLSRHRIAILIPYRNRLRDLQLFLWHMHPFLQRQQLDYTIYVVEQELPTKFNRAMLLNIGFTEANKLQNYSCFFFHDVDHLPEDDRNIYGCPRFPKHMSSALDKHNYRPLYKSMFGGVSVMRTEHMRLINGFSNLYFGWGGEDDDLSRRIRWHHLRLTMTPTEFGRYHTSRHGRDAHNEVNKERLKLLGSARERNFKDGLNTLQYELTAKETTSVLFTYIRVRIKEI